MAICLAACEKEEEPENGNVPADHPADGPADEPITDATVGPEGGMLRNDQIVITIPAGAFLQNETLKLSEITDDGHFTENVVSKRFLIEGLPETFDAPIHVTISYSGDLSGESYVAVGEETIDLEYGLSDTLYEFMEATDSSGYLKCEIYGADIYQEGSILKGSSQTGERKKWISIEVISGFFSSKFNYNSDSYLIYLPANKKDAFVPELIQWLDNAYSAIQSRLFKNLKNYQLEPYRIYLANLDDQTYCKFGLKYQQMTSSFRPKGVLAINAKKLGDAEQMPIHIGREVLRSILITYDQHYPLVRLPDQTPHHWLNQAVITWSEALWAPEEKSRTHVPSGFAGNEMKPFHGLHAGSLQGEGSFLQNADDHGKGMSSWIDYLTSKYESYGITDIYEGIMTGKSPVDALKYFYSNALIVSPELLLTLDWTGFLSSYLTGKHYDVKGSTFMENIPEANIFNINQETDTVKVFQGIYPDLSAQLFRINLNDPSLGEKGVLEFAITGGNVDPPLIMGTLYGFQDGRITPLGDISNAYQTAGVPTNTSLVLLLCNATANSPYTGNSTIELTIRAKRELSLPYTYCQLELKVPGDYLVESNPKVNEPYHTTLSAFGVWGFHGKCDSHSFTGKLDKELVPDTYHGTIRINFDDALNITSYNISMYDRALQADTLRWEMIGTSVMKTYQSSSGGNIQHDLTGNGVCNSLLGLYHYTESPRAAGGINEYTLLNHSCNEDSYLKFSFGIW